MPDLQTSTDLCTFCPRLCSHTCPVSLVEARETVTPQAKMARLGLIRRAAATSHDGEPGEGPLSLPMYACTGCGACTEACLPKVTPGLALLEGRADCEEEHAGHPALRDLTQRQRARAREAAAQVAAAVDPADRSDAAPFAFLPSCLPVGAGAGPGEEALAALRVARRLPPALLEAQLQIATVGQGCGGYPLFAAGLREQFRLYAEVFAREVEGHGALVLGCPSCTWLLRTQYPAYGVPLKPRVLHLSEWLAPLAGELPVRARLGRVTYHDPCYLGRHLGVFDEPRALLARAVAQVDEFPRQRREAACSGGGGLLPLTMPAAARAIAEERLAELQGGDVERVVVTGCASCQRQLGSAGKGRVRALGLLQLLDEATRPT